MNTRILALCSLLAAAVVAGVALVTGTGTAVPEQSGRADVGPHQPGSSGSPSAEFAPELARVSLDGEESGAHKRDTESAESTHPDQGVTSTVASDQERWEAKYSGMDGSQLYQAERRLTAEAAAFAEQATMQAIEAGEMYTAPVDEDGKSTAEFTEDRITSIYTLEGGVAMNIDLTRETHPLLFEMHDERRWLRRKRQLVRAQEVMAQEYPDK